MWWGKDGSQPTRQNEAACFFLDIFMLEQSKDSEHYEHWIVFFLHESVWL